MFKEIFFKLKQLFGIERKIIKTKFFGDSYTIINADSTTNYWYGKEWNNNNRSEFNILSRQKIKNDSLIFNIGAHQGIVALLLNHKLNKNGKIITVEINQKNIKAIKKNFELNNLKNFQIENAAIHEFNKTVRFKKKSNSRVSKYGFSKIKTINIEKLIHKYGLPSLIYLDVEGSECLALRGAKKFLDKIQYFFIEVHSNEDIYNIGGSKEELFEILENNFWIYYALNEEEANYSLLETNREDLLSENKIYLFCINKH